MKFISFLFLNFFLSSSNVFADSALPKADILKRANECLKYSKNQRCKNLILDLEEIQLTKFELNKFKCQTSILGLQTEIIEAFYFKKTKKTTIGIMIPYVIKNC